MTRNGSIWMLTAVLALSGLATPARAQVSDTRIRELIMQAADQVANGQTTAPPGGVVQPPTASAVSGTRAIVRLSLDDAVKAALDKNLDIAVQRLNPEITDIAYASIASVYHPSLTSTIGPQSSAILPTSQTLLSADGSVPNTQTMTVNGGVAQNVPWGGGAFTASLSNFRRSTTINNSLYNPLFQSTWSFAYVQPLLRNFRIDATRQQLLVTKISRDISDLQLRSTITNTLSNVRNAYWDYVFAVQSVDVAKQSVDLATQLVRDNQTRVEVGTMAPIDVVQAQSQAATQQQNLVAAQGAMRTAELALKRLIVSGTQDPNWNVQIDPTDRPEFRADPIDVEAAVRRALSERTDVEIAKKNVEQNDVTLRFLGDQLKPQVDLQTSYGLQGLGGTQFVRSSGVLGAPPSQTIVGGLGDTFNSLFTNAFPTWTAQLVVSYPLGLSTQKANVSRARVQINQVQAQLKQVELQVATDVTNAVINAQTGVERVQAAQAAREFAQKTLEAEQSKFEVGMSTNYNVILAQRDLATAQSNELQSVLNYRKSLVELERVQQTTLSSLNITLLNATGGTTTVRPAGQ
ncbi:MAG: type secretion outer membrane protein TolC family [Acidobacteria bacterium]|nr:type secretion outer membrane protein TolC family [Acidobacteriota bacterium]